MYAGAFARMPHAHAVVADEEKSIATSPLAATKPSLAAECDRPAAKAIACLGCGSLCIHEPGAGGDDAFVQCRRCGDWNSLEEFAD